jgi:hypothetical protein
MRAVVLDEQTARAAYMGKLARYTDRHEKFFERDPRDGDGTLMTELIRVMRGEPLIALALLPPEIGA